MVHLTKTVHVPWLGQVPGTQRQQHLCETCADAYFASTPGMNSSRRIICLSESYRSTLYDLLEATHPAAFDNHDTEACRHGSELMTNFLREHLKKDGVEVSGDAFDMLCQDFFCSHHFYTRAEDYRRRKG